MIRGLGLGRDSLDLLQERESIFLLLPQTKPDSLIRGHDKYSIDPKTRLVSKVIECLIALMSLPDPYQVFWYGYYIFKKQVFCDYKIFLFPSIEIFRSIIL